MLKIFWSFVMLTQTKTPPDSTVIYQFPVKVGFWLDKPHTHILQVESFRFVLCIFESKNITWLKYFYKKDPGREATVRIGQAGALADTQQDQAPLDSLVHLVAHTEHSHNISSSFIHFLSTASQESKETVSSLFRSVLQICRALASRVMDEYLTFEKLLVKKQLSWGSFSISLTQIKNPNSSALKFLVYICRGLRRGGFPPPSTERDAT